MHILFGFHNIIQLCIILFNIVSDNLLFELCIGIKPSVRFAFSCMTYNNEETKSYISSFFISFSISSSSYCCVVIMDAVSLRVSIGIYPLFKRYLIYRNLEHIADILSSFEYSTFILFFYSLLFPCIMITYNAIVHFCHFQYRFIYVCRCGDRRV